MATSPDRRTGGTVFFADSGAIWSMPMAGGPHRRLAEGRAVAPAANGRYVVFQVSRDDGVHRLHVPDGLCSCSRSCYGCQTIPTSRGCKQGHKSIFLPEGLNSTRLTTISNRSNRKTSPEDHSGRFRHRTRHKTPLFCRKLIGKRHNAIL
jgi:hypothetical protein